MKNHIEIISENEFFGDLPDCISGGNSYKEKIENSCKITNGILQLDDFKSEDSAKEFKLELVINGKSDSFTIQRMSDYVDGKSLIKGLNQILKNSGYQGDKRFTELNGGDFDFGIAFVTKEQEDELIENGIVYK